MALSFPLALPEPFPWRDAKFLQQFQQVRSPTRGGLQQVANVGREFWTMRYQTKPLGEREAAAFEAWLSALRGGAKLFKAWHPLRAYPINYPTGFAGLTVGGDPFSGSCAIDDVAETLDAIDLDGLPANFVLRAGDMLSFGYGTSRQALHRVIEDATASSGGVLTATVEPTVALGWAEDAPVSLVKPWCMAVIEASSIDVAWQIGRKAVVSFSASQAH